MHCLNHAIIWIGDEKMFLKKYCSDRKRSYKKVNVTGISLTGKGNNNQDNWFIGENIYDKEQEVNTKLNLAEPIVIGIFDGMGGMEWGEEASAIAADMFKQYIPYMKKNNEREDLEKLYSLINFEIYKYMYEKGVQGGTTAAIAIIKPEGQLIVSNVGDSLIYLCRNRSITQISDNQCLAGIQLKKGMITEETYESSSDKKILMSSLGSMDDLEKENIFYKRINVNKGDKIILVTDGVINAIGMKKLRNICKERWEYSRLFDKIVGEMKKIKDKDDSTLIIAGI